MSSPIDRLRTHLAVVPKTAPRLLYATPGVEGEVRANHPELVPFLSSELDGETVFVVTKVRGPFVSPDGLLYLSLSNLSQLSTYLELFFADLTGGAPLREAFERLVSNLTGVPRV